MEPSKKLGIVKEQVQMEHDARRNFAKKWIKLKDAEVNKFHKQDEINKQVKGLLKLQDLCPYSYTGHGDSYFVSRDMYNALVAKCRCGRQRTEAHILKCVQKEQCRSSSEEDDNDVVDNVNANGNTAAINKTSHKKKLPETSNGFFGFQRRPSRYRQWEESMKYISPVYTMPGHRIAATPYHAIIIG